MAEIIGTVNYIADIPLYTTVKPYSLSGDTYVQIAQTNIQTDERNVKIKNVRDREDEFSYENNSFRFVTFPTAVEWDGSPDKSVQYLEETRQFLLDEFKADRIICYDIRVIFSIFLSDLSTYDECREEVLVQLYRGRRLRLAKIHTSRLWYLLKLRFQRPQSGEFMLVSL